MNNNNNDTLPAGDFHMRICVVIDLKTLLKFLEWERDSMRKERFLSQI